MMQAPAVGTSADPRPEEDIHPAPGDYPQAHDDWRQPWQHTPFVRPYRRGASQAKRRRLARRMSR